MVDDASKELNKVASSAESIVKWLMAGGSPATQKKLAEQKAKTAQQEADNAKHKADNLDEEEDGQQESRVLFAGTMRAGVHIWQSFSTNILSKTKEIFGSLISHVRDALGPVAAFYDAAKSAMESAWSFLVGTFTSFKDSPADKKRNKFLSTISDFATMSMKKMKGEFLETIGEEKKKGGKWAAIMFILGAIIGGIVAAILKPFNLLGMAIRMIGRRLLKFKRVFRAWNKIQNFFWRIGQFFKKIPKMGKFGAGLGKVFKFIKTVGSFIGGLIAKIPGVMSLLKGLKFGFKFLGWPIAVLFALIDFIKGFVKEYGESGSIIDSLFAGLKAAIMGFIELPVKMIGWVIDKVLGWFGVEGADSANKMLGWISDAIDFIFKGIKMYWSLVFSVFEAVFGWIWKMIGPWMKKQWPKIKAIAEMFFTVISAFWEWLGTIGQAIAKRFGFDLGGGDKKKPNTKQGGKTIAQLDAESKQKQLDKEARLEKRRLLEQKNREEWQKKQEKNQKAMLLSSTTGTSEGSEVPQIPDEVDNWGITSKNYDMEMM